MEQELTPEEYNSIVPEPTVDIEEVTQIFKDARNKFSFEEAFAVGRTKPIQVDYSDLEQRVLSRSEIMKALE